MHTRTRALTHTHVQTQRSRKERKEGERQGGEERERDGRKRGETMTVQEAKGSDVNQPQYVLAEFAFVSMLLNMLPNTWEVKAALGCDGTVHSS